MLRNKIAYKIHLPKEILEKAVGKKYYENEGIVICEIPEGKCPYGMEGKRGMYTNANSLQGKVCVCNSDGLVEKIKDFSNIIPFREPPEIKVDSDKPNPRKKRF